MANKMKDKVLLEDLKDFKTKVLLPSRMFGNTTNRVQMLIVRLCEISCET